MQVRGWAQLAYCLLMYQCCPPLPTQRYQVCSHSVLRCLCVPGDELKVGPLAYCIPCPSASVPHSSPLVHQQAGELEVSRVQYELAV